MTHLRAWVRFILPRDTRRIDFESCLSRFSADFSILRRGKSRNSWTYTLCMGIVATYCLFRCLVQRLIYDNRQRPVSPATIHSLCLIESVAISIRANAEISYAPCNICEKGGNGSGEYVCVSECVYFESFVNSLRTKNFDIFYYTLNGISPTLPILVE